MEKENRPWAVWPSVDPGLANQCAWRWKKMGYGTAVLLDEWADVPNADMIVEGGNWRGFPAAVNRLLQEVQADICVVIGDDMFPDCLMTGPQIAKEFRARFPDLVGVMQPTGDKYGSIETCAVAPWIGRGYVKQCKGQVYCEEYFHYFSDEELCLTATAQGCYWKRPDLRQYHDHWGRVKGQEHPPHLETAQKRWAQDRDTFERRRRNGLSNL